MYLAKEDLEKIYRYLKDRAIKDSEFRESHKISGAEYVTIVQDNKNRKLYLEDLNQIVKTGFCNTTSEYGADSLESSLSAIPENKRVIGQIIAFYDGESWNVYRFEGTSLDDWNNLSLWTKDISNEAYHKPENGIPRTDLEEGIKDSLDQIDVIFSIIPQLADMPYQLQIDTQGMNTLAYGETLHISCSVYRGWGDVTDQVISWKIVRDSGNAYEDLAWQAKPKVKQFNGEIDIVHSVTESDLSRTLVSTVFTITATMYSGDAVNYIIEL